MEDESRGKNNGEKIDDERKKDGRKGLCGLIYLREERERRRRKKRK